MNSLVRFFLAVSVLAITIYCQGSRGGGSSSGGSSSGGKYQAGTIAGGVTGGIFGLLAIICGSILCYRRFKGKPSKVNPEFVANKSSKQKEIYSKAQFQTGLWSSRYHQYNQWHGPHQLSLTFNSSTLAVDGQGTDDIGEYTVDGTYSYETNRLALTKVYKTGTGNPTENHGHTVTIQLDWNTEKNQFEGKWYIQTKKYRGEDKFELQLNQNLEQVSEKQKY
ncbi:hypothetical protein I4U23_016931 [Adineta vaga]|nr:hypothetical protein I4U23_016931 [Adineta vaga]